MSSNSLPLTISEIRNQSRRARQDQVAVEERLEIRLGYESSNGHTESSISVTMRTPGNDAELATGFLFTESIIRGAADIAFVKPCGPPAPDSGNTNVVRVGRNNAVDKVVGTLLSRDLLPAMDLGLLVSGRASFELMQKTVMAGMPLLAAISAPSNLAVDRAREFNITLVGFLRGDTFNIYSSEERIR